MKGNIRLNRAAAMTGDGAPASANRACAAAHPALAGFHPAVADWFARAFPAPTAAQEQAWPAIQAGANVLVAAPTGSGKTLTAFLAAIDALVRDGLGPGGLADVTQVVYVSPLKALSNDIHANLEAPLAGIRDELARQGLADVQIRVAVRTGDTPQSERAALRRTPPHILVTTPESLYVLLGSDSGRQMLAGTRSVIVDEIHALMDSKRGSHLSLSLERLQALCERPLTRIGLSATQKPIDEVARFLVGAGNLLPVEVTDGIITADPAAVGSAPAANCTIVDIGHQRERDLALVLPDEPLQAVMSHAQWEQVYRRIAALVQEHATTLVFVNTRRMAERAARHLADLVGQQHVAAHHGSLSRESRLNAEQRLKHGQLKVLVATASLELGIDIGDVDLVCQLGSPRSIAAFLQRVGRAGHHVGGVPKGRLFPASRGDLVECTALLECIRRGELDALAMLQAPLDVLAQQVLAEVAAREWDEDGLYQCLIRAWPYARLTRADFDAVVRMLCEGFSTRRGMRAGYLHHDAVNNRLRGRKGARLAALTSGGTIPETGDYNVVLEPQATLIGTVNEDFAVESLAGDVFQLGNASYRILRVEAGRVRVEDAQGMPPSIPFWLGEAPGRSDELSSGVSRLHSEAVRLLEQGDGALQAWLVQESGIGEAAAAQLSEYLGHQYRSLGALANHDQIVMERFFDESGGTQLVIHSPYGSRVNRAWGLALRKRFCRKFNFELQAAATEDAIVLSLSTSHSFPLIDVAQYLHSSSAEDVLVQALLDAPLFAARWRWNATNALALPRFSGGKKTAPQLQRMKSEDLLATVFPDQVACLENIVGEREIPDHPLVAQTLADCLHEAMDSRGWLALLKRMESGDVQVIARDVATPSPFAAEALNARPYAFLDDAPLEERRTQAVMSRRYADADTAGDLGKLDQSAIDEVREQAWPDAANADEMHDALMGLGWVSASDQQRSPQWSALLQQLARARRATLLSVGDGVQAVQLWCATERLPQLQALYPQASLSSPVVVPDGYRRQWTREDVLIDLLRARLTGLGPVHAGAIAEELGLAQDDVVLALARLESDGYVMRGRFSSEPPTRASDPDEWCERHLLARIHRYTIGRLRREIEPVQPRDYIRFLCDWQHLSTATRVNGPDALAGVLSQLEGFEAAAGAWEAELLPARVADYTIHWLDDLCTAGRVAWSRLRASPGDAAAAGKAGPVRATPIVLVPRKQLPLWSRLSAGSRDGDTALSSRAAKVAAYLHTHGASFFDELLDGSRLLHTELEDALAELVARGQAHCDSFAGLRALLMPQAKRPARFGRRSRRTALSGIADAGRWSQARRSALQDDPASVDTEAVEHVARVLLRRYGVVCWRMIEREAAWLPPWRELLRVYRRLEARGEIRGGRFISGLSGEQFASPEAIAALRTVRRREHDGQWISVCALDPLNLVGSVLPGDKVPRIAGARLLYRDGVPVAKLVAGEVQWLEDIPMAEQAEARRALLREPHAAAMAGTIDLPGVLQR